jgi:hypothetical protein
VVADAPDAARAHEGVRGLRHRREGLEGADVRAVAVEQEHGALQDDDRAAVLRPRGASPRAAAVHREAAVDRPASARAPVHGVAGEEGASRRVSQRLLAAEPEES